MSERGTEITCPLCGYRFPEDELECHRACPMAEYCNVECCPRCGYQIVRETKTVRWIKRLFNRA